MNLPSFLKSKSAFFIALFLLIFLLGSYFQKNSEQMKIDKEKSDLEKQAFEIENKNADLQKTLQSLSSVSSKEKIARSQLNLKKQGETLYSFSESKAGLNLQDQKTNTQDSNLKKWLYFFSSPN